MSQKDLDKLFRDALGEGRAQPRPDSWARVAAGLPSAAACFFNFFIHSSLYL